MRWLVNVMIVVTCIFQGYLATTSYGSTTYKLDVLSIGYDSGWECNPPGCIVGGREGIRVRVFGLSTPYYTSLNKEWPPEITIEAGHTNDKQFVPDNVLLELLELSRMIEFKDKEWDSIAQANNEISERQRIDGVCYKFVMSIPEQYAGQLISLRVTYDSPATGQLIFIYPMQFIAPCDEKTKQITQASFVKEAYFKGDYDKAVEIADSLVALGWQNPEGLGWAIISAKRANRYEDALHLMDLDFEANGRITVFSYDSGPTERQFQLENYQRERQEVLEMINQQRQR